MDQPKKVYDLEQARLTIQRFCAYQERSQKQVRERLQKMGLIPEAIDLLMVECIEGNFLNEERFAMAFVRGKHRVKGWGRKRLDLELKRHEVSDYCRRKAMEQIDEEDYTDKLRELAEKRWEATKETDLYKRGKKVMDFLLRRGFESDRVRDIVHEFINAAR